MEKRRFIRNLGREKVLKGYSLTQKQWGEMWQVLLQRTYKLRDGGGDPPLKGPEILEGIPRGAKKGASIPTSNTTKGGRDFLGFFQSMESKRKTLVIKKQRLDTRF